MSPATRTVGLDGKTYPRFRLTAEEADFVVGRCHYLAHDEGLSVRQIAKRLYDDHGLRRAVGTIAGYLAQPCEKCSGGQTAAPEHRPVRSSEVLS